jgi:ABC-type Fe3+/spermidine/putrescine transport system ATPase subunit
MALLRFEDVHFSHATRKVLAGVSFELHSDKILVVLGPSGAGKTSILRLAAGLEAPRAGIVYIDGEPASATRRVEIEPARRRTSLVFQDLALWPHLNAYRQLAFAGPQLDADERRSLLAAVGLRGFESRLPADMSGGERQRLALGRALASKPRLLLLDEPFSNLDPELRSELRELLVTLHRERGVVILYVTHDLPDAFFLGDEIAFLNEGRMEQIGTPEDLYLRPATRSVAAFVGRGALVPGHVRGTELETPFGVLPNPRPELEDGCDVEVLIRPGDWRSSDHGLEARIEKAVLEEGRYLLRGRVAGHSIWLASRTAIARGRTLRVELERGWPVA